jgi:hypothetical protein
MRKLITALALTAALLASPSFAYTRHHTSDHVRVPGQVISLPGMATWHGLWPAGNAIHDNDRYGAPPRPTGAYARAQDFGHYRPVDTYDVVMNGQIVGRDPDPFIRLQLLHEAQAPLGGG